MKGHFYFGYGGHFYFGTTNQIFVLSSNPSACEIEKDCLV